LNFVEWFLTILNNVLIFYDKLEIKFEIQHKLYWLVVVFLIGWFLFIDWLNFGYWFLFIEWLIFVYWLIDFCLLIDRYFIDVTCALFLIYWLFRTGLETIITCTMYMLDWDGPWGQMFCLWQKKRIYVLGRKFLLCNRPPTNSAIHNKLLLIRSVSYSRHEALIYIMF
jgi:hypothetical protein